MARLSRSSRTRSRGSSRSRALPWMLLGQAVVVLRDHWRSVDPADRVRLTELVKASRGRPMHLTPQQRQEITNILARADIKGLGRDLAPIASRRTLHRRGPRRRV